MDERDITRLQVIGFVLGFVVLSAFLLSLCLSPSGSEWMFDTVGGVVMVFTAAEIERKVRLAWAVRKFRQEIEDTHESGRTQGPR